MDNAFYNRSSVLKTAVRVGILYWSMHFTTGVVYGKCILQNRSSELKDGSSHQEFGIERMHFRLGVL